MMTTPIINDDYSPTIGAWFGAMVNDHTEGEVSVPGNQQDVTARQEQLGRKHDIIGTYRTLKHTTMASLSTEKWLLEQNRNPFVMVSWPNGQTSPSFIPDVAAGLYDEQIKTFAANLKQLSGRILLRPTWEFNHDGFQFFGAANYGGDYSKFVAAWQRIWTVYRGDEAEWAALGISGTPLLVNNVRIVWCPGAYGKPASDYCPYWPGDRYVDWIGIDSYNRRKLLSLRELVGTPNQLIDWYATYAPKCKPMMIGETGIRRTDAYPNGGVPTRAQWHEQTATELQTLMPQIKAYMYFDVLNPRLIALDTDYRLDAPGAAGDSAESAFAAYKAMGERPHFRQLATC